MLKGAVAVVSTDVAGGGAYEPGGVGAGLMGSVTHSVTVTVTVEAKAQAGKHVSLSNTKKP